MRTITIFRGDTLPMERTVFIEGVADPRQDAKMWFTLKRSDAEEDTDAITQKTSDSGEGITATLDADTDIATFAWNLDEVALAKVTDDDIGKRLVWDVQYRGADDRVTTLEKGNLVIKQDVTKTTV